MQEAAAHDVELKLKLHRMRPWLDRCRRPLGLEQLLFDAEPSGDAYLSIDANSVAPAASFNENRVYLCGAQGGLKPTGLDQFIRLFEARGIKRFFVWLSPGPRLDEVQQWLQAAGFKIVPWTKYPTLARRHAGRQPKASRFEVLRVGRPQILQARAILGDALWDDYLATADQPGFHHFMAFTAERRPVATALLACFEGLGYLTFAGTDPDYQGQGAQQALIAARLALAQSLGCTHIASETLSMLPHSLSNLEQLGFATVCEKQVYEWQG